MTRQASSSHRRTARWPAALAAWTVLSCAACTGARAQLIAARTYCGVGRAIPVEVVLPAGAEGEPEIRLYASGELDREGPPEPLARAAVEEGLTDLAGVFPALWRGRPACVYAQLAIGGEEIGAPLVLQPMIDPARALLVDPTTLQPTLDGATGTVLFQEELEEQRRARGLAVPARTEPVFTGYRVYGDALAVLETTEGAITFRLRPDHAPNTVWAFRDLVAGGFYTDVAFHRVVPTSRVGAPFVIQAGDPTGSGEGGPGFWLDLEDSRLPHDFGVLSMARDVQPDTGGSQFFVALSRVATARLDRRYTAFGQAVAGAEAIAAIGRTALEPEEPGAAVRHRPANPPVILRARLDEAPAFSARARPVRPPSESIER